ncbi:hypothetical protein AB6A40_004297 [Gnathostoma spinigerum]|uniref:Uncharacterized protein n=1 Tax=Gnathostoma spinigerum TaxID=75299 RepID=A0ABD6EC30_9BILA
MWKLVTRVMGWLAQVFCISVVALFILLVQIMKRIISCGLSSQTAESDLPIVVSRSALPITRTIVRRRTENGAIQELDVSKHPHVLYSDPPPPYPGLPSASPPDPPSYDNLPGSANGYWSLRPPAEAALPMKR